MKTKPHILVLGNGFDIMHGLPTSYGDFIDTYPGQSHHFQYFKKVSEKMLWIDVEFEIKNYKMQ